MKIESLILCQKILKASAFRIFSFVPQGTISFAWHTQYHFERSENIIAAPRGTNERSYGVAANEVALRSNDVMLRINDVALRANGHAFGVICRETLANFTILCYNSLQSIMNKEDIT